MVIYQNQSLHKAKKRESDENNEDYGSEGDDLYDDDDDVDDIYDNEEVDPIDEEEEEEEDVHTVRRRSSSVLIDFVGAQQRLIYPFLSALYDRRDYVSLKAIEGLKVHFLMIKMILCLN